jgi:hypothetical protein
MNLDRDVVRVGLEIAVGAQDGKAVVLASRAEQEIGVRSLDAVPPADVEELCRPLMILSPQREIWEGGEVLFQILEVGDLPDSREDLLPDGTDDANPGLPDQFSQLQDCRVRTGFSASQGQRPDAGVHQDTQPRARCFL